MPDIFNMTNLSNANDFVGIWKFANEVTLGAFSYIILFVIFMVFFMGSSYYQPRVEKSFLLACFVTMMSSWFMYAMGLVPAMVGVFFIGLTLVAGFVVGRGSD